MSDIKKECPILFEVKVYQLHCQGFWLLDLEQTTKNTVFEKLRPMAEDWIGNKLRLTGTSVYGIRKYTRGATLAGHLDHMKSHVVSAILNIAQVRTNQIPALRHVTTTLISDWLIRLWTQTGRCRSTTTRAR